MAASSNHTNNVATNLAINLATSRTKYEGLDKSRYETRFVFLAPSTEESEELQCSLTTAEIDRAEPFTALSYCWGDPTNTVPIKLNGHEHHITTNLADFLRRIRQNQPEWLQKAMWIDAICINQEDIEERDYQVPLMRAIYQSAATVFAWLGDVNEGSPLGTGMELLKDLSTAARNSTVQRVVDLVVDKDIFLHGSLAVVRSIAMSPWWTRRWVLQEMALPKHLFIFSGQTSLWWEEFDLGLTIWWLICSGATVDEQDELSPATVASMVLTQSFGCRELRKTLHEPDSRCPTLLELLIGFRRLKQQIAHDAIYALCGLASDGRDHPVTYGRPAAQVFIEFAIQHYKNDNNLNFLQHCASPPKSAVEGLPTWVPDWATTQGLQLKTGTHAYNSTLGREASFSFDLANSILAVEAVKLGVVLNDFVDLDSSTRSFWTAAVWEHIVEMLSSSNSFAHQFSKGEALYRTVHHDVDHQKKRFRDDTPLFRLGLEKFQSKAIQLVELPSGFFPDNQSPVDMQLGADFPQVHHMYDPDFGPSRFTLGHWLFRLGSGYLGAATCPIQAGDLICIIFGYELPAILRKRNYGYAYIGNCFLLGFMDGEAVELVKEGKLHTETLSLV